MESDNKMGHMGKRGNGKPLLGLPLPKFGHQLSLSVSPSPIPAPIFLMILEFSRDPAIWTSTTASPVPRFVFRIPAKAEKRLLSSSGSEYLAVLLYQES